MVSLGKERKFHMRWLIVSVDCALCLGQPSSARRCVLATTWGHGHVAGADRKMVAHSLRPAAWLLDLSAASTALLCAVVP